MVDDHATAPDGQMVLIDLADKALRCELEKKLIAWLCSTGVEVLNRNSNPGWQGGTRTPRAEDDMSPVPDEEVAIRPICRLHHGTWLITSLR